MISIDKQVKILRYVVGCTILLCFSLRLFSQDSTLVTEADKAKKTYTKYYVLTSDKTVKNGEYKVFYYPPLGIGALANTIKISGRYVNNRRDGLWTLYAADGTVLLKIDYTKYKIIYKSPELIKAEKIDGIEYTEIDLSYGMGAGSPPDFETGFKYYFDYIAKNIRKDLCPGDSSEIRVYVKFLIRNDHTIDNIEISESAGEPYDEEALRLIRNSSGMWFPGDNPKHKRFEVPVIFKNYGF